MKRRKKRRGSELAVYIFGVPGLVALVAGAVLCFISLRIGAVTTVSGLALLALAGHLLPDVPVEITEGECSVCRFTFKAANEHVEFIRATGPGSGDNFYSRIL